MMGKAFAALKPVVLRAEEGEEGEQRELRGLLNRYAELYA
jgi:hypothetical protein